MELSSSKTGVVLEQQIDCVHSIDVVELTWGVRSQLTDVVLEQTTETSVEKPVNQVMDNCPKKRKQEERDLEEAEDRGTKEGKSNKDREEEEKEEKGSEDADDQLQQKVQ